MLARLAHLVRAVLLGVSLLAALTAWVFAVHPDWVDAFDAEHVAAYGRPDTEALARAVRPGATRASLEAELVPLLSRTAGVRKGDRLAPCRREAFAHLARARLVDGDLDGAWLVTQAWRAFDPLDLDAALTAQQVLAAQPARAADARKLADELFAVAPDRERFLQPVLADALARHDGAAVAAAFFAHLRAGGTPASAPLDRGWSLLADDGTGFDPVREVPVSVRVESDELRVTFAPPPDCKRLRLALPPRVAARLQQARWRIAAGDRVVDLPMQQLARQTGAAVGEQGFHYDGDSLVLDGQEQPFLQWSLGPGARVATTWTLAAHVVPALAPWLGEVLAVSEVGAAGTTLLEGDTVQEASARARYRACRRAALERGHVRLQVDASAPIEVPLTPTDEGATFLAPLRRRGATHLRLTLPAVAGLEVILATPAGSTLQVRPGEGLHFANGRTWVRGAGTVLELDLSGSAGELDEATLQGGLR